MAEFLTTHTLRLTPLSPIHIGCGQDFDATQYVMDKNQLFVFTPEQVPLSEDKKQELLAISVDGIKSSDFGLSQIQNFIQKYAEDFKKGAKEIVAVAPSVQNQYTKKLKGEGNNFYIEKTLSNPHTRQVYIPASSVKGALRTGMLDQKNNKKKTNAIDSLKLESDLLGDKDDGISRFFKLSDFVPSKREVARKIIFGRYVSKSPKKAMDLPESRKEAVTLAQYRAFTATVTLLQARDEYKHRETSLSSWICACNDYYHPLWRKEMEIFRAREYVSSKWLNLSDKLIASLEQKMKAGEVALIRLGRYGGAESKVLTGEGVARINLNKSGVQSTTNNLWLSSEKSKDDIGAKNTDLLPFGWAVIEVTHGEENEDLLSWCAEFGYVRQEVFDEQERQEAAELAAKQARDAQLATLSPHMRKIEELAAEVQNFAQMVSTSAGRTKKQGQNQAFDNQAKALVKQALEEDWAHEEKARLKTLIEKELGGAVEKSSDAKEQRKRFKLGELNANN